MNYQLLQIAQLVEHCTSIKEVLQGLNPVLSQLRFGYYIMVTWLFCFLKVCFTSSMNLTGSYSKDGKSSKIANITWKIKFPLGFSELYLVLSFEHFKLHQDFNLIKSVDDSLKLKQTVQTL